MSERKPLGAHLNEGPDAAALERLWRERVQRKERRRSWLPLGLAVAAVAVVAVLVWPRESGPLALVSGLLPGSVSSTSERVAFDDGSVVTLDAGARFGVNHNDGKHFDTVLEAGRVRLSVTPGGPRRWTIDCGVAKVVVVGTELVIDRQGPTVEVSVSHGRVLVQSSHLAGGEVAVGAGESVRIAASAASQDTLPKTPGESPEAPAAEPMRAHHAATHDSPPTPTTPTPATTLEPAPPPTPSPGHEPSARIAPAQEHARPPAPAPSIAARPAPAPSRSIAPAPAPTPPAAITPPPSSPPAPDPTPTPTPAPTPDPGELLEAADIARRNGEHTRAAALLEQFLATAGHDDRAPIAAFTLGRLEADVLVRPARAAAAFERALPRLPKALEADALARLALARQALGQPERARETARRYLEAYPDGPRAPAMRALSE